MSIPIINNIIIEEEDYYYNDDEEEGREEEEDFIKEDDKKYKEEINYYLNEFEIDNINKEIIIPKILRNDLIEIHLRVNFNERYNSEKLIFKNLIEKIFNWLTKFKLLNIKLFNKTFGINKKIFYITNFTFQPRVRDKLSPYKTYITIDKKRYLLNCPLKDLKNIITIWFNQLMSLFITENYNENNLLEISTKKYKQGESRLKLFNEINQLIINNNK